MIIDVINGTIKIRLLKCPVCHSKYVAETKTINYKIVFLDESLEKYCPKCKIIFNRKDKIEKLKKLCEHH